MTPAFHAMQERTEGLRLDQVLREDQPLLLLEDTEDAERDLEALSPQLRTLEPTLREVGTGSPQPLPISDVVGESEIVESSTLDVDLSADPGERRGQIIGLNREYLQQHVDLIRVHTDALQGQLGRGHQSAAVAVVEQLTRDYCGITRIEILIEASPQAMYVFNNLIPSFDVNADRQTLTINNCRITVVRQDVGTESAERPMERVLGIHPASETEFWLRDGTTNIEAIGAMMRRLGSRELMVLNPHAWPLEAESGRFIDTGSMTYPVESSASSIYRGNTYRDSAERTEISPLVRQNILRIAELVQSGEIDVWPSYGLHFMDSVGQPEQSRNIATNMMLAASEYQVERSSPRPMIIVNLSGRNPIHTEGLSQAQATASQDGVNLERAEIVTPLSLDLQPMDVIFLDVGALPRDWFSLLMGHGTMPIMYEGANTANLAHQLDQPFMSIRPEGTTPYVELPGFDVGRRQLERAGRLLSRESPAAVRELRLVLQAIDDPTSPISLYIREVLRRAHEPEADQLLMALFRLRDIF